MNQFLKTVPLFAKLSAQDLSDLSQLISQVTLKANQVLFNEGDKGDRAYIIQEGEIEVFKDVGDEEIVLGVLKSGQIVGEMSLIEAGSRTASARTRATCRLLALDREPFIDLLRRSSGAALAILHTVISRLRTTEGKLRQSERLAQLGTITSQVAQELDEPATKTERSSEELRRAMSKLEPLRQKLYQSNMSASQLKQLFELEAQLPRRLKKTNNSPETTFSAPGELLQQSLHTLNMADPARFMPVLSCLDDEIPQLTHLADDFSSDQLTIFLEWLAQAYDMYSLFEQLRYRAQRVSEIVRTLKTYSSLDSTTLEEVNLHDELEVALAHLRTKIEDEVTIERHYDHDLPTIRAYGDELSQVWTNIIDNALHVLPAAGHIILRTYQENGHLVIEIEDNGPGIPAAIQAKLFEPFFTTKTTGDGMGLGLYISQKIIQKHQGQITFHSKPHQTCFIVKLPRN